MLSKFFINRPIFAGVISITIVLMGLISIPLLPIEKTPDITPPTVLVSATYPGASAETIAETVATPLEEQINGVDNMIYMSSKSSDDGTMELTVTFEVGTDIDMATVLVQNRVAMAEPLLPADVIRYGITTQKQSTNITLVVALLSPEGRYDETFMSNYINIYLKDSLSRVGGVGNIEVFGAKNFAMRLWLNPDKLKARHLTTHDIIAAVQEQNVQVAAGQLGTFPIDEDQVYQYTLKTLGRLSSVEQFENIIIRTTPDGRILRLKDVARIELGSELYNWFVQHNGRPSVALGVFQLPGANSLEVAKNIRKEMKSLSKNFPEGLDYTVAFDPTLFISESIKEVLKTLLFAVFLVVLVVFIFLEDWRAALVPSITIPVSLIGTLAVMVLLGISLNTLSLFGLMLIIGIVVDDAIVVVENTSRLIKEEHLSSHDAAIKAMQQVTGPIIATTLVLLAVFIPTTLIGGVSGKLFTQFAVTISVATLFSTVNALTLSPALCSLFLRPGDSKSWFFRKFDRLMSAATTNYMAIIKIAIRKSAVMMTIFAILAALTWTGFSFIPQGFMPQEDEGYFFVNVELPTGASLHRTQKVTNYINQLLEKTPGISEYVTVGGFSMLNGVIAPNSAIYFVMLEPWDQRKDSSLNVQAISGQLQAKLGKINKAQVFAFTPPPIMGVGSASGFQVEIQDREGAGFEELEKVAKNVTSAAEKSGIMTRMNSSFRANMPQYYIDIDREKAKKLDVPLNSLFTTLQANLGSFYINDLNLFGRTYKVLSQASGEFRTNKENIKNLDVRGADGKMVPLRTLVEINDISGPQTVFHYNLYPSTTITGEPTPGNSTGQAMNEIQRILEQKMSPAFGYEWSGLSYQQIQAGNRAPIIFALAAIFAYLFLAAQYESWLIPVSIMLVIPVALFGAVVITFARAYDNNVYTQIAIVLLIALSSKTAILLVEFAKLTHDNEGADIIKAAETASRLRFRPILMTALSFVFGVFPLVISAGAGSASRRALGSAVFGGMLATTVIGVFLIPVFYVVVQKLSDKLNAFRKRN
jgi:HAE1 family hydrophobic/amphiphilic exporter-1